MFFFFYIKIIIVNSRSSITTVPFGNALYPVKTALMYCFGQRHLSNKQKSNIPNNVVVILKEWSTQISILSTILS